jgi:SP family myo-inositol transporter-like MFS transporter 13
VRAFLRKLTPTGTYGLYAGFCLIGFVFTIFCYPETSEWSPIDTRRSSRISLKHQRDRDLVEGLALDQTQSLFTDGYGIKKSAVLRAEKARLAAEMKSGATA